MRVEGIVREKRYRSFSNNMLVMFLLGLCLIFSAFYFPDPVRDAYYIYNNQATKYLDHLSEIKDPVKQDKLQTQIIEILAIVDRLKIEEKVLSDLFRERERFKSQSGFFWSFNPDTRRLVDNLQLHINDQLRKIQNLLGDANIHWRYVKSLEGVFSKMFLYELLFSVIDVFGAISSIFLNVFTMGALGLLILGPIAILLILSVLTFGPILLSVMFYLAEIYWVLHLPSTILQYDPSLLEFCMVYFPIVGSLYFMTWYLPTLWTETRMVEYIRYRPETKTREIEITVEKEREEHVHNE